MNLLAQAKPSETLIIGKDEDYPPKQSLVSLIYGTFAQYLQYCQLLDDDTFLPMGGINTQFPATDYCKKSGISGSNQVYLAGFGCMEYVMEGKDY